MHSSATLKALRLEAAHKIAKAKKLDLTDDGKYAEAARQQNAEEHMVRVFIPKELGSVKEVRFVCLIFAWLSESLASSLTCSCKGPRV
jgi:hypothetical protein